MPTSLQQSFRTARKAARVSQLLVAEYSGVSRPTVSAIERRGREPRLGELARLAALLRVSPEVVMRGEVLPELPETSPKADPRISFRATGDQELATQDKWELAWARTLLPECEADNHAQPGKLGPNTTVPAVCAAILERLGEGAQQGPTDVLKALLKKGQPVHFTALSKISGALVRSDDGKRSVIVINSDQPSDRQRWTAVHELAHLTCGHHGQEPAHVDRFGPARDPSDKQADSIAAEVLMPTQKVVNALQEMGEATPEALYRLADRFRVSYAAMVVRCGVLGYLTSAQVTELRRAKPTELEKKLRLKAKWTAGFEASAVLPGLITRLERNGTLPPGWERDFSSTGPLYLRRLQADAVCEYILNTDLATRQTSVTEVFEAVASWLAHAHPWAFDS